MKFIKLNHRSFTLQYANNATALNICMSKKTIKELFKGGWSSSVKKDRPLFSVIITDVYDHDTELSLCADCLKELQKAITKALK